MNDDKDLALTQAANLSTYDPTVAYGFEETKNEDIIIPRIKVIQALSPERLDGIAVEGELLNSLTQEKMNGRKFIPIKQYYSNIYWNPDRQADPRMFCRSIDGRVGQNDDGALTCAACKKNLFDNAKTGREAQPLCTSYLNFLGFFEGDSMPVVLSFARTNYNEGKKLLSIAKSMRCAAWNYAYSIETKKVTKDKNVWYNLILHMAGETTPETRALAFQLYKAYESVAIKAEYEDTATFEGSTETDDVTASEI